MTDTPGTVTISNRVTGDAPEGTSLAPADGWVVNRSVGPQIPLGAPVDGTATSQAVPVPAGKLELTMVPKTGIDADRYRHIRWSETNAREADEPRPPEKLTIDMPTYEIGDGAREAAARKAYSVYEYVPVPPGAATWKKVDGTGRPLGGTSWNLWRLDDGGDKVGKPTAVSDLTGDGPAGADTDRAPGAFKVEGLADGRYALEETVAPPGYLPDGTLHRFPQALTPENRVIFQQLTNTAINHLTLMKVSGTPVQNPAAQPLRGAEFTIRTGEATGSPIVPVISDGSPEPQERLTTGEDGTVAFSPLKTDGTLALKIGTTYWLHEERAPGQHQLLPGPVPFTVSWATDAGGHPIIGALGFAVGGDAGQYPLVAVRPSPHPQATGVTVDSTLVVGDPATPELPEAGGPGLMPILATGLAVLILSLAAWRATRPPNRTPDPILRR